MLPPDALHHHSPLVASSTSFLLTSTTLSWWLRWQRICLKCGRLAWIPVSGRSPGEWNGSPLQYSYLENPIDRGDWGLQSMGLQRVKYSWATNTFTISQLLSYPSRPRMPFLQLSSFHWGESHLPCGLSVSWFLTSLLSLSLPHPEYGGNIPGQEGTTELIPMRLEMKPLLSGILGPESQWSEVPACSWAPPTFLSLSFSRSSLSGSGFCNQNIGRKHEWGPVSVQSSQSPSSLFFSRVLEVI